MRRRKQRVVNPLRVKINRVYTIEEAARCCGVHRCTVRRWLKNGLASCDGHRPPLIRGDVLRKFLQARRAAAKRPCGLGQMYCVRCREVKIPALRMADYKPRTDTWGDLVGLCPDCGCLIHRRINIAKLPSECAALQVALPKDHSRISETEVPSLNAHLNTRGIPVANDREIAAPAPPANPKKSVGLTLPECSLQIPSEAHHHEKDQSRRERPAQASLFPLLEGR